MQEITAERFERLEQQVRRLRGLVMVMAAGIGGVLLLGATGKPDELTLRRLAIVDAEGRERIVAGTLRDGRAGVQHFDPDANLRISVGTTPGGTAWVRYFDREGKKRISAGTLLGGAAVAMILDQDGKKRIAAATYPDGLAAVTLRDRNENKAWAESSP